MQGYFKISCWYSIHSLKTMKHIFMRLTMTLSVKSGNVWESTKNMWVMKNNASNILTFVNHPTHLLTLNTQYIFAVFIIGHKITFQGEQCRKGAAYCKRVRSKIKVFWFVFLGSPFWWGWSGIIDPLLFLPLFLLNPFFPRQVNGRWTGRILQVLSLPQT